MFFLCLVILTMETKFSHFPFSIVCYDVMYPVSSIYINPLANFSKVEVFVDFHPKYFLHNNSLGVSLPCVFHQLSQLDQGRLEVKDEKM